MWPFEKKSARRQEIRRSKAERQVAWVQRWRERVRPWPFTIALGASIVTALILNAGGEILDLRVGEHAPRAIASRLDFKILDEQQTRLRKVQARDTASNYYDLDVRLLDEIRAKLIQAINFAKEDGTNLSALKQKAASIKVLLDDAGAAKLVKLATPDSNLYIKQVDRAIQALARQAFVEPLPADDAGRRTPLQAILLSADGQPHMPPKSVTDLVRANNVESAERVAEIAAGSFDFELKPSMRNSIRAMLRGENDESVLPIYLYNKARSDQRSGPC